jgi:hypothetical protein
MNPDTPFTNPALEKYPALMMKEHVAKALGLATHCIPPLVRVGLLRPLGNPSRYCVKLYSRDVLAQQLADVTWQDKVAAAIHRHWIIKNSRRQNQLKEAP